jgi:hypothetical protein
MSAAEDAAADCTARYLTPKQLCAGQPLCDAQARSADDGRVESSSPVWIERCPDRLRGKEGSRHAYPPTFWVTLPSYLPLRISTPSWTR